MDGRIIDEAIKDCVLRKVGEFKQRGSTGDKHYFSWCTYLRHSVELKLDPD